MSKTDTKETQQVGLPEILEKRKAVAPVNVKSADNEEPVVDISSEGRKKFVMGRLISTIVSDDTMLEVQRKRRKSSGG